MRMNSIIRAAKTGQFKPLQKRFRGWVRGIQSPTPTRYTKVHLVAEPCNVCIELSEICQ